MAGEQVRGRGGQGSEPLQWGIINTSSGPRQHTRTLIHASFYPVPCTPDPSTLYPVPLTLLPCTLYP